MAYVNSRSGYLSISDRLATLVKLVKEAAARRRVYSQTVLELSSLTDRDLADLGLARGNIAELAHEAAYTK